MNGWEKKKKNLKEHFTNELCKFSNLIEELKGGSTERRAAVMEMLEHCKIFTMFVYRSLVGKS